jgi:hypothetical protein
MPLIAYIRPTLLLLSIVFSSHCLHSQIVWGDVFDVAPASDGALRPQITTNASGHPLIIWGKSPGQLMYSRWDGNAFTAPIRLNPSGTSIAVADWMGPSIASKRDTVYIVYKQTPEDSPNSHIWCLRSFNGGVDWDAPVRVEYIVGDGKSRFPTVITDDEGHPVIGYMKFNPTFGEARWVVVRSDDYGATFSDDAKASGWSGPDSEVCDCCPGSIESDGQTVVMLYRDNNDHIRDSWAGISYDGGLTFTEGKNVDQQNWEIHACPSTGPSGVLLGDTLYSTFMNAASGAGVVYYNASSLSADSIPPAAPIDGLVAGRQQNFPTIAHHSNAVAMAWRQLTTSPSLLLSFTENIHSGLPADFDTIATEYIAQSDIAVTSEKVFVVWQSETSQTVRMRMGTYEETTAIHEISQASELIVLPNPANNEIHLPPNQGELFLYNMTGELMMQTQDTKINIEQLPPGMFVLRSAHSWGRFVKK